MLNHWLTEATCEQSYATLLDHYHNDNRAILLLTALKQHIPQLNNQTRIKVLTGAPPRNAKRGQFGTLTPTGHRYQVEVYYVYNPTRDTLEVKARIY